MEYISLVLQYIQTRVDPFLWELFIVPVVVVGLGVLAAILSKKFIFGPIITFFLMFTYNFFDLVTFYPDSIIGEASTQRYLFGWCLIHPLVSLVISFFLAPPTILKQLTQPIK